jgi:hypothetical protein
VRIRVVGPLQGGMSEKWRDPLRIREAAPETLPRPEETPEPQDGAAPVQPEFGATAR